MNLSENAARGEKIVAAISSICSVVAVLPILTLNLISAVLGFGAARLLKSGSTAAKTLSIILRVADIPLLAAVMIVAYSFAGETFFKLCFIAVVLVAAFDMVIIMALTSSDAKSYFHEVYEFQQLKQPERLGQSEQSIQAEQLSELLVQNEISGIAEFPEQTEYTENEDTVLISDDDKLI